MVKDFYIKRKVTRVWTWKYLNRWLKLMEFLPGRFNFMLNTIRCWGAGDRAHDVVSCYGCLPSNHRCRSSQWRVIYFWWFHISLIVNCNFIKYFSLVNFHPYNEPLLVTVWVLSVGSDGLYPLLDIWTDLGPMRGPLSTKSHNSDCWISKHIHNNKWVQLKICCST